MPRSKSRIKNLTAGDLVTHALYGKEWIGVVLEFVDDAPAQTLHNEKALVQIQPSTKFDGFFKSSASKKNRKDDNLGYVSTNWLFKIETKKMLTNR